MKWIAIGLSLIIFFGAVVIYNRAIDLLNFTHNQLLEVLKSLERGKDVGEKVSGDNEFDKFRGMGQDGPDFHN